MEHLDLSAMTPEARAKRLEEIQIEITDITAAHEKRTKPLVDELNAIDAILKGSSSASPNLIRKPPAG